MKVNLHFDCTVNCLCKLSLRPCWPFLIVLGPDYSSSVLCTINLLGEIDHNEQVQHSQLVQMAVVLQLF